MDDELDLSERCKIVPQMPGDRGDPKPLPIRHDIAILADVLGSAETLYGRRQPITLSKENPTGGVAVKFTNVVVDNVLSGQEGGKITAEEIVVKGPVEGWPAQIVASVPAPAKLRNLIDFLKEARSNPAARRLVKEWLRQQTA